MKNLLLSLLVSCSALGLSARAADTTVSFGEVPVATIAAKIHANGNTVTAGTNRIHVRLRLGAPAWVLADGSWIYPNYVVRTSARDAGRPASLLVRFESNQVTRLAMIDEPTRVALRTSPNLPANHRFVAVAKASR